MGFIMKKVCHLTSVHRILDQRIFSKELKSLQQHNYDVTLIAPSEKDVQIVDNIKVVGFRKPENRLSRVLSWWTILNKAIKVDAEIYHFHDPDLIFVGLFIKWFGDKHVIYDVHEPYPETMLSRTWVPKTLKKPAFHLTKLVENFIAQNIKNIVVCDDYVEQRFKKIGCNVSLVRNFIRKSDFSKITKSTNKDFLKTVTHIGTLTPPRGSRLIPDIVYHVSKVFPDVKFEIVDFFRENEDELEMKKMLREKEVENNVIFMPVVESERIQDYISRGIIGLSIYEEAEQYMTSIPTKLFEYIASGVALVATDLPPYREFAEEGTFGVLVKGSDPYAYAKAIIDLLRNPDYAIELGKKGMNLVLSKYCWENEEKKLLDLYSTLLNRT
jgi:glycosyltransferase involved in cell wall biosynthesis